MSARPESHTAAFQQSAAEAFKPSPWYRKLFSVVLAIFLFELGIFLIVFPWARFWNVSYFGLFPFWAHDIWVSPYFRGAVSGLGAVNIYMSFLEVFRLRRFSPPAPTPPEAGGTR